MELYNKNGSGTLQEEGLFQVKMGLDRKTCVRLAAAHSRPTPKAPSSSIAIINVGLIQRPVHHDFGLRVWTMIVLPGFGL